MTQRDVVEDNLRSLVADLYEFIIGEPDRDNALSTPRLARQVASHASYASLAIAISRDESMRKFFPPLIGVRHDQAFSSLRGLQTWIVWSDGTSEGMNILTLCVGMIGAIFRTLWTFVDHPSLPEVLDQLPSTLSLIRNLAEKRAVKVPAMVAIHNVELPQDHDVSVGSALLRHPNLYDKLRLVRFATALGPAVDAVLRLEVDFCATHISDISRDSNSDEERQEQQEHLNRLDRTFQRYARLVQRSTDMARLTLVLASSDSNIIAPVQGFQTIINPLTDIPVASRSNIRSLEAPYPKQTISESIKESIVGSSELVQKHRRNLDTGVRRLLQAITERLDPEDGLVDAIICWENLFSASPETTLRVCGAMAKLLSPPKASDRQALYGDLKRLYNTRNKLVHGSSDSAADTIYADRDAAVQYALDALRAVYGRDDLVNVDNSATRGTLALLGP